MQLWGYATSIKDFFGNLEGRKAIPFDDLFKFRQRAREMQSWMLNLRSAQTAARFDKVRRRINDGIDGDVRSRVVDSGAAELILDSIDSAFEFLFSTTPTLEPLFA
ncbi:MAG TPA: hypothetical protein VEJ46_16185 [Candidatus Acidoferrum sp.]|nr:hypothetical protein [Candidatus Acidoferrum sp.]